MIGFIWFCSFRRGADATTLGAATRAHLGRVDELVSAARGESASTSRRMRLRAAGATVGAVLERLVSLARSRRAQHAGDVALAFLLAASSLALILVRDDTSWGTPESLAVGLALFASVPVAWRSQRPLLAAAIVLFANGACAYAAAPHEAGFQPFVALTLAFYSVGSHVEGRGQIWAPVALAVAALPLFAAAVVHGQSAGNAIPNYVWLLAAWAVGRTIRSWRRRSVELEHANRELAASRELQAHAAVTVERGRIARELHDVVAHNVSMMVVQAGAAARVLEGAQPDVRAALEAIALTGRETVDEMRTLLGVLRSEEGSAALRPQPGLSDLDQLVAGVREAGLPVSLRIEGSPRLLPQALDLSAFRIVQEALTNTLKHARGAQAEVTVRYAAAAIDLEIRDRGGVGTDAHGTGHGLVGMRERVAMFGGSLEAAASDGGFTVRASLPLESAVAS
jgi:signal transduction histidine kinase